nr:MAG: putative RNA-dependent RNA polymerase [Totiviridae sp.]
MDHLAKFEEQELSDGVINRKTLTWKSVIHIAKQSVGQNDQSKYVEIPSHTTDIQLQEIFKPRAKVDLSLRRFRMVDLLRHSTYEQRLELGRYTHLDYIFVQNIFVYMIVFGVPTLRSLRATGMFNNRELFLTAAKELSTLAKRYVDDRDNAKQKVCELATIIGYMNPAIDELNVLEEVHSLAAPGNPHGVNRHCWQNEFDAQVREIMEYTPIHDFIPFELYVKEGKWLTSGSSSIGTVEWFANDEKGHFKARKNMLTQLYTPDDIYNMCVHWDGKLKSRVFIKNEMSKLRLAVASNIEAYIHESYMLYLYGHGFKNYFGITLDESPTAQHIREIEMVKMLQDGAYGFPFDYKSFDHQPTTSEIQSIIKRVISIIMPQIPSRYYTECNHLFTRILDSYTNSYLSGEINDITFRDVRVKGGVPSGVRSTSLIGNLWNSCVTHKAIEITESQIGQKPFKHISLRGDDVAILSHNPMALYALRVNYAAINAIGLDSKLGISPKICEFLRNEIRTDGIRGWTCRGIGGLSQRKPWNPSPWSPNAEVTTNAANIGLLERRVGYQIPQLHQINKIKWSKHMRQSYKWLELPIRLGGFGLYPFQGWLPNCKLPLAKKPLVDVQNVHPSFTPFITLNQQQTALLAKIEMTNKMQTDDIPGTQKLFSKEWINQVKATKCLWNKTQIFFGRRKPPIIPEWDCTKQFPSYGGKYITSSRINLTFEQLLRQYNLLKEVKRYDKSFELPKLMDVLQNYFPAVESEIRQFEKQGFHRTDAINLAIGEIPSEPTIKINPILTRFVKQHIDKAGVKFQRGRRSIAYFLYHQSASAQAALLKSTLNQMYRY